jgi:hypothetical protein
MTTDPRQPPTQSDWVISLLRARAQDRHGEIAEPDRRLLPAWEPSISRHAPILDSQLGHEGRLFSTAHIDMAPAGLEDPEPGSVEWTKLEAKRRRPYAPSGEDAVSRAVEIGDQYVCNQASRGTMRTRLIDYDPATGEWTAQRLRGAAALEAPRVVARSASFIRPAPVLSPRPVTRARSRGRREHRAGHRRTSTASRAGPDGLGGDQPPQPARRGELRPIAHVIEGWLAGSASPALERRSS